MKNIFLFLIFIFFHQSLSAQKIHAILFGDVLDESIGKGCSEDMKHMHLFLQRLNADIGIESKPNEKAYVLDDFNPGAYDEALSKIKSSPNDIIIFYVSSHGERGVYDQGEFPHVLVPPPVSKSVYDIFEKIQKMPHASSMVIIDACNNFREATQSEIKVYPKGNPPPSAALPSVPQHVAANARRIFLEDKFNLIITSSQVGVESMTNQDGSVFTSSFISSFDYYLELNNPAIVNIENILQRSRDNTLAESSRQYVNYIKKKYKNPPAEKQAHYPYWEFSPDRPEISFKYRDLVANAKSSMELTNSINYILTFKTLDPSKSDTISIPLGDSIKTKLPSGDTLFAAIKDIKAEDFEIKTKVKKLQKVIIGTHDDYQVDVYVASNRNVIGQIDKVTYYLDPTFKKPVVTVTNSDNDYRYRLYLWGTFLLKAKIIFKDGRDVTISKQIELAETNL